MNVYDFDGTIYDGDCSIDFYAFCIKRYPWLLLFFPYQLAMILAYKLQMCSKEDVKSAYFSFIKAVPNVQLALELFWNKNKDKVASWYMAQKQQDDVVISASPSFLLTPICRKLGVDNLIASEVDCESGRFIGKNCFAEEKVKRFEALFGNAKIEKFYSDSETDLPMAERALMAYKVKKAKKIIKWDL